MIKKTTVLGQVFVTNPPFPPFGDKTYCALRGNAYQILNSIVMLVRRKLLGPCKGIQRAVKENFKTINYHNTVWAVFAKVHREGFS